MATETYKKIKKEIKQELLQEFINPILRNIKDAEGEYKKEFVARILEAIKERPNYAYNPKTFLRQISGK